MEPELPKEPEPAPGTLEALLSEVKGLMSLASRYSVDITASSGDIAKATRFWRLNEVGKAHVSIAKASEELKKALETYARKQIDAVKATAEKLGLFAPLGTREALIQLDGMMVRHDYETLLPTVDRFAQSLSDFEKGLGAIGKFISALRAINGGIVSLGGHPPSTDSVLQKAHASYARGQPQVAEAALGLAVSESLEALAPLLAQRIALLTQAVRKAHEKGKDTREAAMILKQVTIALRSRNYLQVLGLLHRAQSKLPAMEEEKDHGDDERSDGRPHRRIRGHSTSPASEPPAAEEPSETPLPAVKRGRSYLFVESHPRRTLNAFRELRGNGNGLVLTATWPPKIVEEGPIPDTDIVWISESEGWQETFHPKMIDHEISARILNFLRAEGAGAVALDGLGQLISAVGADRVEKFLKLVLDVSSSHNVSLIVSLSPDIAEEKGVVKIKALFDHVA